MPADEPDAITDPTTAFFAELARRGHEPLLGKVGGTLRFDLKGDRLERWLVEVRKGDVTVSRGNGPADCIVRGDRVVFDAVFAGEANAFAAVLRGAVTVEGDFGLLVLFQRLFPGSAHDQGSRGAAGYARRQA